MSIATRLDKLETRHSGPRRLVICRLDDFDLTPEERARRLEAARLEAGDDPDAVILRVEYDDDGGDGYEHQDTAG